LVMFNDVSISSLKSFSGLTSNGGHH